MHIALQTLIYVEAASFRPCNANRLGQCTNDCFHMPPGSQTRSSRLITKKLELSDPMIDRTLAYHMIVLACNIVDERGWLVIMLHDQLNSMILKSQFML